MIDMNKFQAIQLDINNNCNIRCSFCINDWTKKRETTYMSIETFDKVMKLLPLVKRGFLSCSFEPTIHPSFIEFFKRVPEIAGVYTFITTNLAKKFKQEELEELGNMNLNSITISLISLNAKVYEEFCVGAKFSVFIDNLERLVAIFKKKPNAPKLRFITVVFKQNLGELEHIVETCNKKYLSILNQFRTIFKSTSRLKDKKWADRVMPSKKEWEIVKSKLAKLPYNIEFFNPFYSVAREQASGITNTYFTIRSDGMVIFHERDKQRLPIEFRSDFNISDIDKPYEFFKKGL